MTHLFVTLQILAGTLAHRRRPGRDVGLSTLEVVVIGLGLFLLAGALVAVITVAVNSRMNQIK